MKCPKRKSSEGEREFASFLTSLGLSARRQIRWASLFAQDADVLIEELPNLHVEARRAERLNVHEALAKALLDADRKVPVLAFRRNRSPWFIAMRAEDWISLLKGDGRVSPRVPSRSRPGGRNGGPIRSPSPEQ